MPTARQAVQAMLQKTVEVYTQPGSPRGCLVSLSAIHCEAKAVRNFLCEKRRASLDSLRRRLEQAAKDGDLSPNANVAYLSEFYRTVQQGLALRAREGVSRKEMLQTVHAAMSVWDKLAGTNFPKSLDSQS